MEVSPTTMNTPISRFPEINRRFTNILHAPILHCISPMFKMYLTKEEKNMLRIRIDMLMEFPDDFGKGEIKDIMKTGEYFPENVIECRLGTAGFTDTHYDNYYRR